MWTRVPDRREPDGRRCGNADSARHRGVRRLRPRAVRPARPALPAPLRDVHQLRAAVHHHPRVALRSPGHHHVGIRHVRPVRGRIPRSGGPPLPRAADRLPRLRTVAAVFVGSRVANQRGKRIRCRAVGRPARAGGGCRARRQGDRRVPPGLRRRQHYGGGRAAGPKGAGRQAFRHARPRPRRRAPLRAHRRRRGRGAVEPRPPDRAAKAAAPKQQCARRRRRRAGQPAARADAAVLPHPSPAAGASARRRRTGARRAGADQREPFRRADLLHRRRCRRTASGAVRRGPRPQPADPRPVRRLGGARHRQQGTSDPPIPRLRAAAGRSRASGPGRARRGWGTEKHLLPYRRHARLHVRSHRRHGHLGDAAGVRARGGSTHRNSRRAGATGRRPASRVSHPGLGGAPCRRSAAGSRPAPPRARGLPAG